MSKKKNHEQPQAEATEQVAEAPAEPIEVELAPPEPETVTAPEPVKVGDLVHVTLARGGWSPAKVEAVREGGLLDIAFEHNGTPMRITGSPHDPTGLKPDCWL